MSPTAETTMTAANMAAFTRSGSGATPSTPPENEEQHDHHDRDDDDRRSCPGRVRLPRPRDADGRGSRQRGVRRTVVVRIREPPVENEVRVTAHEGGDKIHDEDGLVRERQGPEGVPGRRPPGRPPGGGGRRRSPRPPPGVPFWWRRPLPRPRT